MIITLPATTTDEIVSVLLTQEGATGSSRVLTLVIDTCAAALEEALRPAREPPSAPDLARLDRIRRRSRGI